MICCLIPRRSRGAHGEPTGQRRSRLVLRHAEVRTSLPRPSATATPSPSKSTCSAAP